MMMLVAGVGRRRRWRWGGTWQRCCDDRRRSYKRWTAETVRSQWQLIPLFTSVSLIT